MVGVDHAGHEALDIAAVCVGRVHEVVEIVKEAVDVELKRTADVNLRIFRLLEAFLGHELLFVELLAGAKAGVFDLDVHIRFETGEADEVARKRVDLDGAAHVEDEDLAATGVGAREEDEADGLGDGHEVADDVRVRDRDGTALLDLLFEDRDDAAVGAEDVAEADGHELGADVAEEFCICLEVEFFLAAAGLCVMREELRDLGGLAFLDLGVETLDDHLAQTLRGAHDVGRIDGLIGGNQHEALAAVHHGRVSGLVGADGIVFDGLAGAVLHERHVLVGRCVVHDVGLVLLEDLEHFP